MMIFAPFFSHRNTGGTAPVAFVTAMVGSGVTSLTFDGTPEAVGDLVLYMGCRSTGAVSTPQSPLTSLYANHNGTLGACLGWHIMATGSETYSTNNSMTRPRAVVLRNATTIDDWEVTYGTGTSATQSALTLTDDRSFVQDMVFSSTAGLTMGDPANMTFQSGSSSGNTWRAATAAPGSGSFTPGAVSLSSSAPWVRLTVAVK